MTNTTKGRFLKTTALCIDVLAPLAATVSQFPFWVEKSPAATVSGLFLVFVLLSVIPFFKHIRKRFKTPSVFAMWCIFLVMTVALKNIIDQMLMICLVGAVSNGIGTLIYKVGQHVERKLTATECSTEGVKDDSEVT